MFTFHHQLMMHVASAVFGPCADYAVRAQNDADGDLSELIVALAQNAADEHLCEELV